MSRPYGAVPQSVASPSGGPEYWPLKRTKEKSYASFGQQHDHDVVILYAASIQASRADAERCVRTALPLNVHVEA